MVPAALFLAATVWAPVCSAARAAPVAVFDAFLAALFFAAVFFAAVFLAALFFAAGFSWSVSGPSSSPALPVSSSAAAAVELSDAVLDTAVFFATMAAAPSHIVILHANRAGTINRPQPHGNGARRRSPLPAAGQWRACNRCAQLPAR